MNAAASCLACRRKQYCSAASATLSPLKTSHLLLIDMAIEKTLYQIESLLIVDDSTVQRQHTVGLMREMGVELIYEAGNGHEALELLAMLKLPPSLAIIDLEMPGMDGVELIQQLQRSQATFPLIVASSRENSLLSSVETMIQALGMRVLGALQKPLNREKIVEAMKS